MHDPAIGLLPASFSIESWREDSVLRLSLSGELDHTSCNQLSAQLGDGAATLTTLIVDLHGLTFIDSSGLAALVRLRSVCAELGAHMTMIRAPGAVQRVIAVAALGEAFDLVEDERWL